MNRLVSNPSPLPRGRWLLLALLVGTINLPADTTALLQRANEAFVDGAYHESITHWTSALTEFRSAKNLSSTIRTLLSLAGAHQAVGQHRRAISLLEEALEHALAANDPLWAARARARLGGALVMTRNTEQAESLLLEALEGARSLQETALEAELLNEMGNLFLIRQQHEDSLSAYLQSVDRARLTSNASQMAQALCNAATAAARSEDYDLAMDLNTHALQAIERMDNSRAKAFLLLVVGQTEFASRPGTLPSADRLFRAYDSFQQAMVWAQARGDLSVLTYAFGYLGQLYALDGQIPQALQFTRQAAFAAQQAQMPEAGYRWEWQAGRLLRAQGESEAAIAAYRRAVQSLDPIRNDVFLGYGNASLQRSFRETEGPLYLELADLLLQRARLTAEPSEARSLLLEARDTVEYLKAVELEDYFKDDCVNLHRSQSQAVETVDPGTAVIYLVPLPHRTEILVGLSSGLTQFTVDVGADTLHAEVHRFRRNLETRTTYAFREQAERLYDWLIRPLRGFLNEHQVHTLVFVPDGALRTIPLASLHDGTRFLIQDLAVAVTPGLSLIAPSPLERQNTRLLLSGLSDSVQGFAALPFVEEELTRLQPLFPGQTLYNQAFTLSEFSRRLQNEQYSVVHIASHGQFDRDARNTFVLTYDSKLTLNQLEALIRPSQYRGRPVELLVLSACQTAAGDDRAALGLAGVALKAGARSALATLWSVNDQSTSTLINEVYHQLHAVPGISKARALQNAQVQLLADRRYRHPCYWSPYLIIGNWL